MGHSKGNKPQDQDSRQNLLYSSLMNVNMQNIKKIHELSIVRRINDSLRFVPNMKNVCCSIIDTIRDEINVRYCSIMILDTERKCLVLKALWSPNEQRAIFYEKDSPHYRFKLDEGVAGRVAKDGLPILISDVTSDDRFVSCQSSNNQIKSLLCMPLKSGEEVVGVLNLSHHNPAAFGKDEQHLLDLITNQIAIALKNVHMFEQMKEMNRSLEKMVRKRTKKLESINEKLISTRDQLVHSEKMAALGTLAGGVAHEFNNLLCMIQGYAELAVRKNDQNTYNKALSVILSASERAKIISRNLLSFSKRTESKIEQANLRDAMEQTIVLIERDIEKDNIKIVRKYEDIPDVVCDVSLIQQVFLNIIINARHAIAKKGGTITIHIYRDKQYAVVAITDTGPGIKKEIRERIFEPFFTTKGVWGNDDVPGTGLGLSVSLGVIESHHGTIEVDSVENKGATFRIKLPILSDKEIQKAVQKTEKRTEIPSFSRAKILVADDEEAIRELLSEMLTISGHKVKLVANGYEAIEICKKERFDVVFMDIMMPGISGVETVKTIQKQKGHPVLVFITGLNISEDDKKKYQIKKYECITKPFKFSEVNQVLNRVLSEPALFYNI
ncbi:MAG: response regulator [Candidatus Auribacterota bacterium]|jgi:signal transduction histidine kinase|nr:response regulator [Candidatus Auribacterota bacterium]